MVLVLELGILLLMLLQRLLSCKDLELVLDLDMELVLA